MTAKKSTKASSKTSTAKAAPKRSTTKAEDSEIDVLPRQEGADEEKYGLPADVDPNAPGTDGLR